MNIPKWLALVLIVVIAGMTSVLYVHHLIPMWVTITLLVLAALGVVALIIMFLMALSVLCMFAELGAAFLSVFLDRAR